MNSTNGTIQKSDALTIQSDLKPKKGFAHSITDLNNDYKSDIVLTVEFQGKIKFYVLENMDKSYREIDSYEGPSNSLIYGQSLFADFDSDGSFEHLLPTCNDQECSKPIIFIRKLNKVRFKI